MFLRYDSKMSKVHYDNSDGHNEVTSVLFGPQGTMSPDTLLAIRRSLHETPALEFLSRTIAELPTLWPDLLEALPGLEGSSAQKYLSELACFFREDSPPAFPEHVNTNTLLSPLTVIHQIVEFWKLSHGVDTSSSAKTHFQDVQGFCVGFLTASAVSCSKNETEFQSLAAKAVRLALCIGITVDLDLNDDFESMIAIAVRWRSDVQAEYLKCVIEKFPNVSTISTPTWSSNL